MTAVWSFRDHAGMTSSEDPDPQEFLEVLKNEDAERLKQRILASVEALLAEKYVDKIGLKVLRELLGL